MSELRADTITARDGTRSMTATQLHEGTSKVWARNTAAGSLSDSYSVSSLDDDGTGNRGLNLSITMSAATFTKLMSIDDGGTTGSCLYADVTNGTETTSAFDFESYRVSDTSNRTNLDRINYARCIGNLA